MSTQRSKRIKCTLCKPPKRVRNKTAIRQHDKAVHRRGIR